MERRKLKKGKATMGGEEECVEGDGNDGKG